MDGIITNARDLEKGVTYISKNGMLMELDRRGRSRIHKGCIYYMRIDGSDPIPFGTPKILDLELRPISKLESDK